MCYIFIFVKLKFQNIFLLFYSTLTEEIRRIFNLLSFHDKIKIELCSKSEIFNKQKKERKLQNAGD